VRRTIEDGARAGQHLAIRQKCESARAHKGRLGPLHGGHTELAQLLAVDGVEDADAGASLDGDQLAIGGQGQRGVPQCEVDACEIIIAGGTGCRVFGATIQAAELPAARGFPEAHHQGEALDRPCGLQRPYGHQRLAVPGEGEEIAEVANCLSDKGGPAA
jgi:hypothetical protein